MSDTGCDLEVYFGALPEGDLGVTNRAWRDADSSNPQSLPRAPDMAKLPLRFVPKWWHLAALLACSLLVMWLAGGGTDPHYGMANLDIDVFPKEAEKPPENYVSNAERELADRLPVGLVAGGRAGVVEDAPEAEPAAAKQVLERREKSEVDALVQEEIKRLNKITQRYYKSEPKVREVDKAFGALPRYMDVKRRYLATHDAYAFAHEAIALPEVRETIYKYAVDPHVWRVTLGMVREGLKEKPPKILYDEMKRFFTQDKEVRGFAAELSAAVAPKVLTVVLPQVLKPGEDVSVYLDLARDLNIGKNGVVPPPVQTAAAPAKKPPVNTHKGETIGDTGVPVLPDGEIKIGDTESERNQQLSTLGKGAKPRGPTDVVKPSR